MTSLGVGGRGAPVYVKDNNQFTVDLAKCLLALVVLAHTIVVLV